MNNTIMSAFLNEMIQIKEAGSIIRNLGEGHFVNKVLTNVVNTTKAFGTPVQSFKTGIQSSISSTPGSRFFTSGTNKALLVGGAALGAPEAFAKEDPTDQGRSRSERTALWAGDQVGGIIGAPHGLTGTLTGTMLGRLGAKAAYKGYSKVKGFNDVAPGATMAPGNQMKEE